MDETFKQAHHGSVAAIIQILNEQLAAVGVRTRAVWGEGVLQILCEAATVEQLEQTVLVRRSQDILLKKPNVITRLKRVFQDQFSTEGQKQELLKASVRKSPRKIVFWQGLVGGLALGLLGVTIFWLLSGRSPFFQGGNPGDSLRENPEVSSPTQVSPDVFAEAVILATEASQEGQEAKTSAQWLALAAKWEQAAELMNQISTEDLRYKTAQSKVVEYRQNSEIAQKQAQNRRSP